jgi:hypothetical protein
MTTRAKTADNHVADATTPTTVTATVLDSTEWGITPDRKVRPIRLEVDGDVYTLDNDQEGARRDRDRADRRRQLRDLLADRPDLQKLTTHVENDVSDSMTEEMDETVRAIGWIMVHNNQHEIWRLAYLRFAEESAYTVGDETRFLLKRPTGQGGGFTDPDRGSGS